MRCYERLTRATYFVIFGTMIRFVPDCCLACLEGERFGYRNCAFFYGFGKKEAMANSWSKGS